MNEKCIIINKILESIAKDFNCGLIYFSYGDFCYFAISKFVISHGFSFGSADDLRDIMKEIRNKLENEVIITNGYMDFCSDIVSFTGVRGIVKM